MQTITSISSANFCSQLESRIRRGLLKWPSPSAEMRRLLALDEENPFSKSVRIFDEYSSASFSDLKPAREWDRGGPLWSINIKPSSEEWFPLKDWWSPRNTRGKWILCSLSNTFACSRSWFWIELVPVFPKPACSITRLNFFLLDILILQPSYYANSSHHFKRLFSFPASDMSLQINEMKSPVAQVLAPLGIWLLLTPTKLTIRHHYWFYTHWDCRRILCDWECPPSHHFSIHKSDSSCFPILDLPVFTRHAPQALRCKSGSRRIWQNTT